MREAPVKIGVLGGSFNPVHWGHLVLAEQVRDALGLRKVLFVPARQPPHKSPGDLVATEHRLAMLRYAILLNPRFEISELELHRDGPSYTVDTIRELQTRHPEYDVHFIIGADSVPELPSWRDIQTLGHLCTFAVGQRRGYSLDILGTLSGRLPERLIQSLKDHFVEIPMVDISSSDIRRRVSEGRSIRHLVPNEVLDYIRTHRLYT